MQMPTHPLPDNAGIASEDTKRSAFPPALGGPFAGLLTALLSAMQDSLWERHQLYFRLIGFRFNLRILYHIPTRLSTFF